MIGSIVIKPPTSNRRLVDVILETASETPECGRRSSSFPREDE
jgi:hypothetical protein